MLGAALLVDGIDGIDDVDYILYGNTLVGAEDDAGVAHPLLNAGGDEWLEPIDVGGGVVHLEVVVLVDVDCDVLLGHGLAAALGKEEFDSIGADERGGHHEEDQQQEHQVGHGRVVVLDGEFVSCLYHGLGVLVVLVILVFLGYIMQVRGGDP